ncbi:hypothetical protein HanRHA438_Chr04g0164551 [Helianthus annuus]|uniref:Uncharacterized protein n=1 Tax=Helianthus annuus TaxID=4232 RepID=A0A9K3J6A5_HELAN|nr:hypothetical protein HanXRQr2_Chr04g0154411 [Helianthus annuus]KAJ0925868.1 hypothetical protein HanRHA438_Chr04g0164551 [Helianthus annuus]KAJ0930379.1 hypothetical protein HanPSC8_Chr04g0148641 [Helianthus annuus]
MIIFTCYSHMLFSCCFIPSLDSKHTRTLTLIHSDSKSLLVNNWIIGKHMQTLLMMTML